MIIGNFVDGNYYFTTSSVNQTNMKWDEINLRYKMNILKVMDLILTLPATSSEVERGLSNKIDQN